MRAMCPDSLFEDVLRVHPPVVLGQFDGEDDAGDEEDAAASQTEPERVLKNRFRRTPHILFTTLANSLKHQHLQEHGFLALKRFSSY